MATMEQPFGENEVRFILAEILKKSSIAPLDLMNLIQERGVQPSWYDISLPNGRSLRACEGVYSYLQANAQARFRPPVQPTVAFEQPSLLNAPKTKKRRPAPGENVPLDRTGKPQQLFNFLPVNAPGDPATDQGATVLNLGGTPKKKRGRPSKAEHEAKVAEAAARGEEYQPPPKRKKTPRPPHEGAPKAAMVSPIMTKVGAGGESSIGENEAQEPKEVPEEAESLASEPTTRSLALEATAHAANPMQTGPEKPVVSTVPETQVSELEIRRSLLADMREHAGQNSPDIAQSNVTLQHYATPQDDCTSHQSPSRDSATIEE